MISFTSLVIALTINGPMLLKNAKDFVEWYRTDQSLSGRWTNSGEGDIEPDAWETNEGDAVFLNITAYQGQLSGTLVSKRLCKYSTYSGISVAGTMAGDDGTAIFWDFIGGERRAFAKARIHINRSQGVLDVKIFEQAPGLFPERFRLGKQQDQDSSGASDDSEEDEAAKNARKEAAKLDRDRFAGSLCMNMLNKLKPPAGKVQK
ncbi:hypothetical protein [Burkholderia cenocepacia]|uniref:hypothetical protein n=1 Tax=Burkholderia cenocepacia TaxID=95486 RepID=UPI00192AB1B6|nr:hypothetical protein [Burkholderia cenocepacia]